MNKKSVAQVLAVAAIAAVPALGNAAPVSTDLSQTLSAISAGKLSPSSIYVKDVLCTATAAQAMPD